MSQTPTPPLPPSSPTPPPFDPQAEHHRRPKIRSVRGFPVEAQTSDGKKVQMLGLADARQISDQMVVTAPAARFIVPMMDGNRDIDQIVTEVGQGLERTFVERFVAQLDSAGLIEGPNYQAMLQKMQAEFDASPVLPPAATAAFVDSLIAGAGLGEGATEEQKAAAAPGKLRELLDQYMKAALEKAEKPSFDELPRAIVAPHLDYPRGWMNYAHVYGRLRVADRPARIVIIGTNHFGQSTGVCGCDKGFQTVFGTSPVDAAMVGALRQKLGDKVFEHRFDHEREHSIELHIPWIQHVFGADEAGNHLPVFGVLVHDPSVNSGESYDGSGVGLNEFVKALKEAIAELPGPTLVISSVDLSHVGPAFGDQIRLLGDDPKTVEFRNGVLNHDREMLSLIMEKKHAELVAAMAWQQNPTRWCSTGALVATLLAVEPSQVELLNYSAAIDPQGTTMVSSVAIAMR